MRAIDKSRPIFLSLAIAVGIGAAVAAGPATALPWTIYNSMSQRPITSFSKADMQLMTKTIDNALSNGQDGVKASWSNPATGSSGSITPAPDPKNRPDCRLAQIDNHHRALHGDGGYIFCKNTDKQGPPWKLLSHWPA